MNSDIFIKSEIINNPNISNNGMLTYIALRIFYHESKPENFVSLHHLFYILTEDVKYNRWLTDSLKDGIKNLSHQGLISIIDTVKANEYIINMQNLHLDIKDDFFRVINEDELKVIMTADTTHNKANILRLFLTIVDSFIIGNKGYVNYHGKSVSGVFAARTIEFFSDKSRLSENAVMDYIKFLEKHKLIYVYRSSDIITYQDGAVISIPNVYGRYKHKMQVIEKGTVFEQNYGTSAKAIRLKQNRNKANEKRSLLAKYNSFVKGVSYPEDTLKDIYEFLLEYNEDKADNPEKNKDLTVFEEYDFYKTDEQDAEQINEEE